MMSDKERKTNRKEKGKLSLKKTGQENSSSLKLIPNVDGINLNETVEFKEPPPRRLKVAASIEDRKTKKKITSDDERVSKVKTSDKTVKNETEKISSTKVARLKDEVGTVVDIDVDCFCQVCQKDVSHMNSQRRTQHVNKCIDKIEDEVKEKEGKKKALEDARTAVLDCPMCGKPAKTEAAKKCHLKKCAQKLGVSTDKMLSLVKKQEEERHNLLAAGILPVYGRTAKAKQSSSKASSETSKRRAVREPKSQYDEDVQMAMAMSSSLAEKNKKVTPSFLEQFEPQDNFKGTKKSGKGKGKRAKMIESEPLLISLSSEEKERRLQNKVERILIPEDDDDENGSTPSLPPSCLKAQSDNPGTTVPGLWQRCMLGESDAPTRELFYVETLIPPVLVSSVVTGSKLKRMSEIPGRNSSFVKQQKSFSHQANKSHDRPSFHGNLDDTMTASTQTAVVLAELAEAGEGQCTSRQVVDIDDSGELHSSGFCPEKVPSVQPDEEHQMQSSVCQDLLRLVDKPDYSDIQLVTTTDQGLHAHRAILAVRCPRLLQLAGDTNKVQLPVSSTESMIAFVKYLYAGELNFTKTMSLLKDVYKLAFHLGLTDLTEQCEKYLSKSGTVLDTCNSNDSDREEEIVNIQNIESETRLKSMLKEVWGESDTDSETDQIQNEADAGSRDNQGVEGISTEDEYYDIRYTQRQKIRRSLSKEQDEERSGNEDSTESSLVDVVDLKLSEKEIVSGKLVMETELSDEESSLVDVNDVKLLVNNKEMVFDKLLVKTEVNGEESRNNMSIRVDVCENDSDSGNRPSESDSPFSTSKSAKSKLSRDQIKQKICDLKNSKVKTTPLIESNTKGKTAVSTEIRSSQRRRTKSGEKNKRAKEKFLIISDESSDEMEFKKCDNSSTLMSGKKTDDSQIQTYTSRSSNVHVDIGEKEQVTPKHGKSDKHCDKGITSKATECSGDDLVEGKVSNNDGRDVANRSNETFLLQSDRVSAENTNVNKSVCMSVSVENEKKLIPTNKFRTSGQAPGNKQRDNNLSVDSETSRFSIESGNYSVEGKNMCTSDLSKCKLDSSSTDLFASPSPVKCDTPTSSIRRRRKVRVSSDLTPKETPSVKISMSTPLTSLSEWSNGKKLELREGSLHISPVPQSKKRKSSLMESPKSPTEESKVPRLDLESSQPGNEAFKADCTGTDVKDVDSKVTVYDEIISSGSSLGEDLMETHANCSPVMKETATCSFTKEEKVDKSISDEEVEITGDNFAEISQKSTASPIFSDKHSRCRPLAERVSSRLGLKKDASAEDELPDLGIEKHKDSEEEEDRDRELQNKNSQKSVILGNVRGTEEDVWDDFDDCGVGFGEVDAWTHQPDSQERNSLQDSPHKQVDDHVSEGADGAESMLGHDDSFMWNEDNAPEDQTQDASMMNENAGVDKEPANFKTPHASVVPRRSPKKKWMPPSPFTPMADYDKMSTPVLKKEVQKYGVRPVGKKRMVKVLKDIYHQTHAYETDSDCDTGGATGSDSANHDEDTPSSQESDVSDMLEESFVCKNKDASPSSSPQKTTVDLKKNLNDFIWSHSDWHVKILMYEPLDIDSLKAKIKEAGIKCSMEKLMEFLDERCITFTMKNRTKKPRRKRGQKKKITSSSQDSP